MHMFTNWRSLIYFVVGSVFWVPDIAKACDFDSIMLGYCPSEVSMAAELQTNGNHAVLSSSWTWDKFGEVKNAFQTSGEFDLTVCVFRKPVQDVWGDAEAGENSIDFSNDLQGFDDVVQKIEQSVGVWETASYDPLVSAVRFHFRDVNNVPNECESTINPHILIAISSVGNESAVGWNSVKRGRANKQATMTLAGVGYEGPLSKTPPLSSGAIRHEFGHALGFYHEMFHSTWLKDCAPFFDAKGYASYLHETHRYFTVLPPGATQDAKDRWELSEEKKAKEQVTILGKGFDGVSPGGSHFDLTSIMMYPIDPKLFLRADGTVIPGCGSSDPANDSTKDGANISTLDEQVMLTAYGKKK